MRLCGISSHFWLLSPCIRQVTHALLTRPPLEIDQIHRSLNEIFPVRLACVKHAASVHPEPGSNSLIKCLIHSRQPTSYLSFYCFWFIQPFSNNEVRFLRTEPHSHLSMLMCKEFSRIVCVSLFSYQGCLSLRQLVYFIISVLLCQSLFSSFFKVFQLFRFLKKLSRYITVSSVQATRLL